jgi:hypothetical protein
MSTGLEGDSGVADLTRTFETTFWEKVEPKHNLLGKG